MATTGNTLKIPPLTLGFSSSVPGMASLILPFYTAYHTSFTVTTQS